jgi:phosphoribosylformylglycinamidine synthase PurS subunit
MATDKIGAVKSAKCYRMTFEGRPEDALEQAEKMCHRLLANPVVHEYTISVAD